ncbi:glycoside hydrolase [Planctomycetaceae bacterium]|jgi:sialidase-1|nr:glycoside hydrolase [Planctomycetaceae bacterium]MDG2390364.1 sialidase family protein [Planctomycetaceae bacterium]
MKRFAIRQNHWHQLFFVYCLLGSFANQALAEELWLDPRLQTLPANHLGPFEHTTENHVLAIDDAGTRVSKDGGQTWSDLRPLFDDGSNLKLRVERAMLRTKGGVLIASSMDIRQRNWTWDNKLHDAPGATLPAYVMRSLDDGKTWQDITEFHKNWTGAVRDIIETKDGRLIVSTMKMLNNPGRHSVVTYWSDDEGKSWHSSNVIDLGGVGHHGGVTEATLVELRDGRIWLLIRTNWGEFWSGYSHDGGKFWRVLKPSGIAASSAPGLLKRLASGRLVLFWNRPYPEGKTEWTLSGGDRLWSEVPVSNHREELSISFSEDDGQIWTKPEVIARQKGTWLAYPYVFEHRPGELWVTTMQGNVRAKLFEKDFVKSAKKTENGER